MDRLLDLRTLQQRVVDKFRSSERQKRDAAWGIYGDDYHDYSQTFEIPDDTLPNFIEVVRKKHAPCGLDLFSGTEMLSSLRIKGIAVGLNDIRSSDQKLKDKSTRWMVTGDLQRERKEVWDNIREQMKLSQIPSFDLITQRGIMGFDTISPDPALHFYHLQKMWSVLSEGGMILTEISNLDSDVLEKNHLYEYWSKLPGIKAIATPRRGLQLYKFENAPIELPINFKTTLAELKAWKRTYGFDYGGNWKAGK
ncbi:hypothetical protein HYU90_01840 [Candidatus Collierbacteria bacterium]|nr:hypothetical protein [Candidatus Collierbacteria bacterium]